MTLGRFVVVICFGRQILSGSIDSTPPPVTNISPRKEDDLISIETEDNIAGDHAIYYDGGKIRRILDNGIVDYLDDY